MFRPLAAAVLLAFPAVAPAQTGQTGTPPQRIRSVTLTGTQKCPPSTNEEVVVCKRLDSPYRVPKELRDEGPVAEPNQSWVNRTAAAEQVGRVNGGVPNSCSPVGTAGQTGCALQAAQAWAAEKRAQRAEAQSIPGGGQ